MSETAAAAATAVSPAHRNRIISIDILRGIVMIIMALDHARDFYSPTLFAPEDPTATTGFYFFTRWITHFCAPTFVFLSGVSAWLYADARNAGKQDLALFLLSRGFWLIFIEIFVITYLWLFTYLGFTMQVIWAIGMSMIILAGLIFLPRAVIAVISLVVIFGHNLLDPIAPADFGTLGWLWTILHVPAFHPTQGGGPIGPFFFVYPLIPWFAVMALGYVMAPIFKAEPAVRNKKLITYGLAAIGLFLVLRGFNIYGNPYPWAEQARGDFYTALSFLNVEKYPPSLLYLCMTLGPALLLLPLLEKCTGKVGTVLGVYGKTPFLFYILHILFLHIGSAIWYQVAYGKSGVLFFMPSSWPEGFQPVLWKAYLAWAIVCILLYWPCKWFSDYRKAHKQWWLSYL
ncbi:DUF1624 domain-containing protein [Emcibacter nanhaiensis]|uniref:DUF1624 domain-containing protein n=1 Tax=Emcibacter nanhaiensis TaxID=1505037 RepID=A0A501PP40_9PROT|nr:heparan-alpha-glucosaminide N-acetyltransferase domain-containing protein [Emcibacter nanhaiensis]TPD61754.1 DUF1624 domain-containing protein [Emcibacter nanhaiensis]